MTAAACRACGSEQLRAFHHQSGVPVNSCLLLSDRDEAVGFPTGVITLQLCGSCGFIQNGDFDGSLAEYSERYEETQAFSPRFVEFARALARKWVDRHGLAGGRVVEIGCGKGEFLTMMAEAGIAGGVGIDPGIDPTRLASPAAARIEWVRGVFDASYGPLEADAVVCRHTLEHIADVREFLSTIRTAVADATVLLFELPDTGRVLEEAAFWDVYYEHCSYFTAGSLGRLFRRCGFEILDLGLAYDDQYLLVEARPGDEGIDPVDDLTQIEESVDRFAAGYAGMIGKWRDRLAATDGPSVIWGASSKGVSFLSLLGDEVAAAVDINPHKQGMFMAGTGHRIVAPAELVEIAPRLVVVMNPVYIEEIETELGRLGVVAEVASV